MIEILTDREQISKAQRKLADGLRERASAGIELELGFQGGKLPATVFRHPSSDIWFALEEESNRFWNAFGVGDVTVVNTTPSITVEINPPYEGIDRRMGGAYGQDEAGTLYLLHRGKVGGGRKGIGKAAFMSWYKGIGPVENVKDGDREGPVVVVSPLDGPGLVENIAAFVGAVQRFKDGRSGDESEEDFGPSFRPEFEGEKIQPARDRIIAACRHGRVVNTLEGALKAMGHRTGSDLRDLFLCDVHGTVTTVFEVKSDTDTTSIYGAVGQLILLTPPQASVRRVGVFPAGLHKKVADALKERGIWIVRYHWSEETPVFEGLEEVLKK